MVKGISVEAFFSLQRRCYPLRSSGVTRLANVVLEVGGRHRAAPLRLRAVHSMPKIHMARTNWSAAIRRAI